MAKNNTKPDISEAATLQVLSAAAQISGIPAPDLRTGTGAPLAVTMVRRAIIAAMIDAGIKKDSILDNMHLGKDRYREIKLAWSETKPTPGQRKIYDSTRQIVADAIAAGRKPRPSIFASGSIPLPVKPRCPSGADIQAMHAEQERRRAMIRRMEYGA